MLDDKEEEGWYGLHAQYLISNCVQCMLDDDEEEGWCSLHIKYQSLVDESSVQCMIGNEEEGWCSLHA
jgi:hypothetical protein